MEKTQSVYEYFIGFDVSKDSVAAHNSRTGITEDIENDPLSLRRYVKQLDGDCLAICEPTGRYEAALLDALVATGIPAHRADARKVKAFIRSLGIYGKTDAIDARALAEYGKDAMAASAFGRPRCHAPGITGPGRQTPGVDSFADSREEPQQGIGNRAKGRTACQSILLAYAEGDHAGNQKSRGRHCCHH